MLFQLSGACPDACSWIQLLIADVLLYCLDLFYEDWDSRLYGLVFLIGLASVTLCWVLTVHSAPSSVG